MNQVVLGLIIIFILSTVAGWLFSRKKMAEKPIKVMLFALYFWLTAFILLMVYAGLYQFGWLEA